MDGFDDEIERMASDFIGACIEVHRHLGPGQRESVYAKALVVELEKRRIPFETEYAIEVVYKDVLVGEGRIDVLIGRRLPCELKAVSSFNDAHVSQTLFYMANIKSPLGILVNFNVPLMKHGIRRVIDKRFA